MSKIIWSARCCAAQFLLPGYHTKNCFLLIEKMKVQLIYGLGFGIKSNCPQVGPGPAW